MTTMNPEVKAQWVKALRSGKFEQGRFCLRREGAYCCLGVLCELYRQEHEDEVVWIDDMRRGSSVFGLENPGTTLLPREVQNWAGLSSRNPRFGSEHSAVCYNDERCFSFDQIADLIEEHL